MPRLVPGKNDLLTCNPVLASEWHPTKNGDMSPAMVSHKANKKYWWLGKCRHEWDASVDKRAYGRGCPYCNNSRILSGHNDLLSQFPEIAAEWDYSKNGSLRPEEITQPMKRENFGTVS